MQHFKRIGGGPWRYGQKSVDLTWNDLIVGCVFCKLNNYYCHGIIRLYPRMEMVEWGLYSLHAWELSFDHHMWLSYYKNGGGAALWNKCHRTAITYRRIKLRFASTEFVFLQLDASLLNLMYSPYISWTYNLLCVCIYTYITYTM